MCGGPFVPAQNGPICFVFLIPLAIFIIINLSGTSLLRTWLRLLVANHWVLTALTLAFCLLIAA